MKKSVLLATAVAAVLVVSLLMAAGYAAAGNRDSAGAGNRADRNATSKAETYAVVQVGNDVRVVTKSELKNLPNTIREEDKKKKKDYDDAKKAAIKNKEKFDLPKPLPRKVTKLKDSFKSEQEANDWKESYLEKKKDDPKTVKKSDVW